MPDRLKPIFESAVVPYTDAVGRSVMVAIAKSTWQIGSQGLTHTRDQIPITYVDIHLENDVQRELWIPSDLTDFKPAAEVILVRPGFPLEQSWFAGNSVDIRVGTLSFSGIAAEPWPFGPLARGHESRVQFAGTYDEDWQTQRMPLLPQDFDPRFNQTAPEAQTAKGYFAGDERVSITGLSADGAPLAFSLPALAILVSGNVRQDYFAMTATLDTILLWTETPAITLVWRHVIRPRLKIAEIGAVTLSAIRIRTARELYG
jgi:hypothetical protein